MLTVLKGIFFEAVSKGIVILRTPRYLRGVLPASESRRICISPLTATTSSSTIDMGSGIQVIFSTRTPVRR
jgi:hypothetical protein